MLKKTQFYILAPAGNTDAEDSPWNPWYGCCFQMLVEAGSPQEARKVAAKNSGAEDGGSKKKSVWLNPELTSCEVLKTDGEPGLIMRDVWEA